MRFLDILSIVSGIASIVSLLLTLRERFAAWRRFILPLSYGLGGFAVGRISASFTAAATSTATEGHAPTVLILFIVVLTAITLATFALLKRNEPLLAYMVFFMGLSLAAPELMRSYSESSAHMPVADLLVLATEKERVKDFSGAISYLEKAAEATNDRQMKEAFNAKVVALQRRIIDVGSAVAEPSASP